MSGWKFCWIERDITYGPHVEITTPDRETYAWHSGTLDDGASAHWPAWVRLAAESLMHEKRPPRVTFEGKVSTGRPEAACFGHVLVDDVPVGILAKLPTGKCRVTLELIDD